MNDHKEKKENVTDDVMSAIHKGQVEMRSRSYFVMQSVLWIAGTLLVFGLALFLVSLIAFIARGNGLFVLPFLGPRGWMTLLFSIPWVLLLLSLIALFALEFLAKHFSFVYRRPLIYSLLGFLVLIVGGGVLIGQTTLHDRAYRFSEERRVPVMGPLYKAALEDRGDAYVGIIETIGDVSFILAARNGERYTVVIDKATRLPLHPLRASSTVIVIGSVQDTDTINAAGVRPLKRDRIPFPHRPPKR